MPPAPESRISTPVANPFRFRAATGIGETDVTVEAGRIARVRCVTADIDGKPCLVPLDIAGVRVLVVAEMASTASGWELRSFVAAPRGARPPAADAPLRDAFLRSLIPVLDGEMRRFVERDLVEVYRARREHDAAMASIQAQVERRLEKMRTMAEAHARTEETLRPAEARLRAELARLCAGTAALAA